MNQKVPTIPCGEYPVLVDYSTKDWGDVRCKGSLYLTSARPEGLKVLPPPGVRPSNGYPAHVFVSADFDHSVMLEIKQVTGDKRTITLWKQSKPDESIRWMYSGSSDRESGPFPMIVYPKLEKLLNYLIERKV